MTDPSNLEEVRALFARHRREIIERYEAHGAGVGRQGDGYAIVVYLDSADQQPQEPVTLEGVPLKFEVTGPFTLHTNPRGGS